MVFGIQDRPRKIIGSNYRPDRASLDHLKQEVASQTASHLTFEEIHELSTPQGRVVMFQIPPALRGIPADWKGHYYGRNGESLGPLSIQEIEGIRKQAVCEDWSAQICTGASLSDLDPAAIAFAREQYKQKNPRHADEVDRWDDLAFLNKSRVLVGGQVTRTAVALLGKADSEVFLSPGLARITWVLKDSRGNEQDYQHFGPPLILSVGAAFAKVRNLTYRYLRDDRLFPSEVTKYEPWVIREALHNCIAHQDYMLGGRINFVEEEDSLVLTNPGHFIPGTVERVLEQDAPQEVYRNPFLATAMVNLNMIDTIGSGIKRMFTKQRDRCFPLPDYDLSDPYRVKVRIVGKVLDENYTRVLIALKDLDLADVIALDKVQKRKPTGDDELKVLRARGLVEGRRPNLYVSARVAAATGDKTKYIKLRAFDNRHYKELVISYLRRFGPATRAEIEDLLLNKVSDALNPRQKRRKVGNLLQEMARKDGMIKASGTTRAAHWALTKKGAGE